MQIQHRLENETAQLKSGSKCVFSISDNSVNLSKWRSEMKIQRLLLTQNGVRNMRDCFDVADSAGLFWVTCLPFSRKAGWAIFPLVTNKRGSCSHWCIAWSLKGTFINTPLMWVVAVGRCTLSFQIGSGVLGLFSDIMSWFLSGEFFFCVPHSGAEILKTNHIPTEGNKLGDSQKARNPSGRYDGSNADWPKKQNCLANSRLCLLPQWSSWALRSLHI